MFSRKIHEKHDMRPPLLIPPYPHTHYILLFTCPFHGKEGFSKLSKESMKSRAALYSTPATLLKAKCLM